MTATLRSFLWSSHPQSWAGNGNCRNHFRKTWSTGVNSHLMQLLLQFLLRLLPWLLLRLHLWNCPSGRSAPYHHQSSTPLKTSHQRRGRNWTEHHHHQNHQPAAKSKMNRKRILPALAKMWRYARPRRMSKLDALPRNRRGVKREDATTEEGVERGWRKKRRTSAKPLTRRR